MAEMSTKPYPIPDQQEEVVSLLPFSFFSFYAPFSMLAQVGRFPIIWALNVSLSFARLLSRRPFFRSSSKTPLHLFLGLPFPADTWPRRSCFVPEQFTVKAQEPLIPTWLYKMVASMEAVIFNCQCDQMQNCVDVCEAIYYKHRITGDF